MLLVFIPLMGDYITATVLGGAKGNMVGQLVASQFQTAQNWALGSAMAVLLILVITATIAVGRGDRVADPAADPPTQPARPGRCAAAVRSAGRRRARARRRVGRMTAFDRPRCRRCDARAAVVGRRADGVGRARLRSSCSLPIVVIIVYSFNGGRLLVAWDGFSFDAFLAIVAKPAIQSAVLVSIQTA